MNDTFLLFKIFLLLGGRLSNTNYQLESAKCKGNCRRRVLEKLFKEVVRSPYQLRLQGSIRAETLNGASNSKLDGWNLICVTWRDEIQIQNGKDLTTQDMFLPVTASWQAGWVLLSACSCSHTFRLSPPQRSSPQLTTVPSRSCAAKAAPPGATSTTGPASASATPGGGTPPPLAAPQHTQLPLARTAQKAEPVA